MTSEQPSCSGSKIYPVSMRFSRFFYTFNGEVSTGPDAARVCSALHEKPQSSRRLLN